MEPRPPRPEDPLCPSCPWPPGAKAGRRQRADPPGRGTEARDRVFKPTRPGGLRFTPLGFLFFCPVLQPWEFLSGLQKAEGFKSTSNSRPPTLISQTPTQWVGLESEKPTQCSGPVFRCAWQPHEPRPAASVQPTNAPREPPRPARTRTRQLALLRLPLVQGDPTAALSERREGADLFQ